MPKRDLANFLVPNSPIAVASTSNSYSSLGGSLQGSSLKRSASGLSSATTVAAPAGGNTVLSLPKYNHLQVSVGSKIKSVICTDSEAFPRGYAGSLSRGDFGGFQCTSRGDSRLLALPPVTLRSTAPAATDHHHIPKNESQIKSSASAEASSLAQASATPDVSMIQHQQQQHGAGVSLRDVWKFGMRAKAPLLTEVDPASIGRPFVVAAASSSAAVASVSAGTAEQTQGAATTESNDGVKKQNRTTTTTTTEKVRIVRINPEWLGRGMVQPPQAEVVEIDAAVLNDDAARLMTPAQRRELMETQRRAREGLIALREVQAARTKLSRTCQKLYPHGALGCVDGPYSEHPDGFAYQELAAAHAMEDRKVGRKGRKEAGVTARPHDTSEVIMNVTRRGESCAGQPQLTEPQKKRGIAVRGLCKPQDQLLSLVVGMK